jgi:antitoxin ParD1/3/4
MAASLVMGMNSVGKGLRHILTVRCIAAPSGADFILELQYRPLPLIDRDCPDRICSAYRREAMETVTIALPESLKDFIEAQVAEGGYSGVSEYLQTLIKEDQKRKAEEKLEALLLEGLNSGEPREMTAADWQEIRREVIERLTQRRAE